ncbi:MAG: hypothetical protein AAF762_11135, partial [Pseudomonadota bacterium]
HKIRALETEISEIREEMESLTDFIDYAKELLGKEPKPAPQAAPQPAPQHDQIKPAVAQDITAMKSSTPERIDAMRSPSPQPQPQSRPA